MSDQKYTPNDSYNELLRNYANGKHAQRQQPQQNYGRAPQQQRQAPPQRTEQQAKNYGRAPSAGGSNKQSGAGVSFNRPNNEDVMPRNYRSAPQTQAAAGKQTQRSTPAKNAGAPNREADRQPAPADEQTLKRLKSAARKKKKRAMRRKSTLQSIFLVIIVLVFVFVAAMMLKVPIMGCVNDLLAIDRNSTEVRVVINDGMNVDEIIDVLADKGLIYSGTFCKLAAQLLDYSGPETYPGGTYDLSPDMGLEGMLNLITSTGIQQGTVTLTFPEGYTVDQIVAKLSENNVASSEDLYAALNGNTLVEKYDFLSAITDRSDRYSIFEGYLYPDTYEFYIGEDPESVFDKFLKNFANRWTDEYDDNLSKLGMTVDEIITLASILEKEAYDAQQMPLIASILFNRIRSTSFAFINCDSTSTYLESIRPHVESDAQFEHLTAAYDTYIKTGLPVGAICNPGADAISAAMHPESSDYYYFLHASDGTMYVARTAAEHEANIRDYLDN